MKKTIFALLLVLLIGMMGVVSAADLQVLSVSTTSSNPPVINQDATIMTDVVLVNSILPVTTTLRVNLGDGNYVDRIVTLSPGLTYSIPTTVVYTTFGTFTLTSTIDPLNTIAEDSESNNGASVSVNVQGALPSLTLTSLSLSGDVSTIQSNNIVATNNGNIDLTNLVFTASNLISGTNTIPSTAITLNPNTVTVLYNGALRDIDVSVAIPAGQAAGTYTGTITATASELSAPVTSTLTVIVNAAPVTGPSFTISELNFGSDNQEREQTVTSTLRITNTGNQALTIALTSIADLEYDLELSQSTITVAIGSYVDISATAYIPDYQDAGTESIGSITATATSVAGLIRTSNVYMTAENNLEFSDIEIDIDGDSNDVDDGDDFDAKPGDDVILSISVENTFSDSIEIQDIEVTVESDGDLDWDESEDMSDLEDGDEDTIDFSFSIDSDVDEENYDVTINVQGEDENGATHEEEITFTINVERNNHEISINTATISPEAISCDRRFTIRTNIENTGSNNEDKVTLIFENEELDIYQRWLGLELDEGDDIDKYYTFTLPSTIASGEYYINIWTYYDTDEESDIDLVTLTVSECNPTIPSDEPTEPTTPSDEPTVPGYIGTSYGTTNFFDSPVYVVILVVAVLALLVLITVLMVKFVF